VKKPIEIEGLFWRGWWLWWYFIKSYL